MGDPTNGILADILFVHSGSAQLQPMSLWRFQHPRRYRMKRIYSMLIRAGYELTLSTFTLTPVVAMLTIRPERMADLKTPHLITCDRDLVIENYQDGFGNNCTRFSLPTGVSTISCDFLVEDCGEPDRQSPHAQQDEITDLPADIFQFLMGSRYCDTDLLSGEAWTLFGDIVPGWSRVQAIVDFVHHHLEYGYKHACATRTASEAFRDRVGVCRDFAHLAIALCRCMNIPARYCSGYLGDIGVPPMDVPMDFHAWFEVYLGGEWHSFDARHRVPRIGRILMACGRDAADTALTTAFGATQLLGFSVVTEEIAVKAAQPLLAA